MNRLHSPDDFEFCGIHLSIMGRTQLVKQSYRGFEKDACVISVVDTDAKPVLLNKKPSGILRLSFDDIEYTPLLGPPLEDDEEGESESLCSSIFTSISDEDARMIVDFVEKARGKMRHLICSCEAGQSRSAAIAAAIMEHYTGKPSPIFEDIRFHPNRLVYKKIQSAWDERENKRLR